MKVLTQLIEQNAFSWETIVSGVVGVVIGAVTSFVVNASLVEISLNTFFSVVTTPPQLSNPIVLWSFVHFYWSVHSIQT